MAFGRNNGRGLGLRCGIDAGRFCASKLLTVFTTHLGLGRCKLSSGQGRSFGQRLNISTGLGLLGCQFSALLRFLRFTQAAFLGELLLLTTDQLGLMTGFFFTTCQIRMVDHGFFRLCDRFIITLDQRALLAHFHLDRAGSA